MKTRFAWMTILVVATVAFAQQQSADRSRRSDRSSRRDRSSVRYATSQPATFIEEYRLVMDRNIFSKTRVIYREPTTSPTTRQSGSYQSQPALALTGVTQEAGAVTAFIEDRRFGRTTYYHVGDALGAGKITAINLDSIEITTNGRAVRVDLGNAIEGGPTYSVSSSFGTGGSPTTNPSSTIGTPPAIFSGDSTDMLEKLRQRRLQETKK